MLSFHLHFPLVHPCAIALRLDFRLQEAKAPQVLLQSSQSPHSAYLQSTGHGFVLHGLLSWFWPAQPLPPCFAVTLKPRTRFWVPPPQSLEHFCQGPKAFQTQLMGHSLILQAFSCSSSHLKPLSPSHLITKGPIQRLQGSSLK